MGSHVGTSLTDHSLTLGETHPPKNALMQLRSGSSCVPAIHVAMCSRKPLLPLSKLDLHTLNIKWTFEPCAFNLCHRWAIYCIRYKAGNASRIIHQHFLTSCSWTCRLGAVGSTVYRPGKMKIISVLPLMPQAHWFCAEFNIKLHLFICIWSTDY